MADNLRVDLDLTPSVKGADKVSGELNKTTKASSELNTQLKALSNQYDVLIKKMALYTDAGKKGTAEYKLLQKEQNALVSQMVKLGDVTDTSTAKTGLFRNKAVNLGADLTILSFGLRAVVGDVQDIATEFQSADPSVVKIGGSIASATVSVLAMTPAFIALSKAVRMIPAAFTAASGPIALFVGTFAYLVLQIQTGIDAFNRLTKGGEGFFQSIENALSNNVIGNLTAEIFGLDDAGKKFDSTEFQQQLSDIAYLANFAAMTLADLKAKVDNAMSVNLDKFLKTRTNKELFDMMGPEEPSGNGYYDDKGTWRRGVKPVKKSGGRTPKDKEEKNAVDEFIKAQKILIENLQSKGKLDAIELNNKIGLIESSKNLAVSMEDENKLLAFRLELLGKLKTTAESKGSDAIKTPDIMQRIAFTGGGTFEGLEGVINPHLEMSQRISEIYDNLTTSVVGSMSTLFGSLVPPQNALTPFQKFVKDIAITFINSVQSMILASNAALFAKGITSFGISLIADAPMLAAAWVALEAAKGFLGSFADGGLIRTSGNRSSDSGIARVSDKEFIVNAPATQRNLPALEAMNAGRQVGGGDGMGVYISTEASKLLNIHKKNSRDLRQRDNWKRY